ncbi:MAG: Uma2 family endonuclease [Gammaproteobacteria bacterium]|nr:Uma2 family endonuclease [Gammaproteobacteria bacterium]
MSAVLKPGPQAYLEKERLSETKNEYINGEIFAMSGASPAHNLIVGNLIRELGNQLKKRPCRVYPSDLRVQVADGYVYPDVTVVCGQPEFAEDDNLSNPDLIVEVLSPSTEDYDLGGKFARYRQLASLREYLLVAQDKAAIMHYARQDGNRWLLTEWTDIKAVLELPGIKCTLALRDVYDKVFE